MIIIVDLLFVSANWAVLPDGYFKNGLSGYPLEIKKPSRRRNWWSRDTWFLLITKHETGSSNNRMCCFLWKPKTSTYRQYARAAQQVGRPFSVVREYSMRVQPTLQARSNRRRANLRSVSFDVLSARVPRSSINLLTLARLRKDDKKDKKKEVKNQTQSWFSLKFSVTPVFFSYCSHGFLCPWNMYLIAQFGIYWQNKPALTGVTSFNITTVTFSHPRVMMNSTHVPGFLIITSPAGTVALVKVDENVAIRLPVDYVLGFCSQQDKCTVAHLWYTLTDLYSKQPFLKI